MTGDEKPLHGCAWGLKRSECAACSRELNPRPRNPIPELEEQ